MVKVVLKMTLEVGIIRHLNTGYDMLYSFGEKLPSPLKTILLTKIKLIMIYKAIENKLVACRTLKIEFHEYKNHPT